MNWIKEFGGSNNDYVAAFDIDRVGNIYLGTTYNESNPYGKGLRAFGRNDMGVLHFDSLGNFQWAEGHGGENNDVIQFLDSDPSGTLYTVGRYTENSSIGVDKFSRNEYTPGTFILRRNN